MADATADNVARPADTKSAERGRTLLIMVAAAGAAVTLLASLDKWITAAKWAKWLVTNWNALTKGLWSTLLWFVPHLSQLDANLLTIICFVLAALLSSMRRRDLQARWLSLRFASASLAGLLIAFTFAQNTVALYDREDYALAAHRFLEAMGDAGTGLLSEQTPREFGYYASAVNRLTLLVGEHGPSRGCADGAFAKRQKVFLDAGAARQAQGLDPNMSREELLALTSRPELADANACLNTDFRWRYMWSPLMAQSISAVLCVAFFIVILIFASKVTGRTPRIELVNLRLWATLAFLAAILALNYGSLALEPWLTNNGISLPS
jgi:hypothetical protein